MKKLLLKILFIVTVFLPLPALCQQKDSVFLQKGQILIGDVKGIELGKLTIDDADLNIITVKLYKIKMLKTVHQFRIETNDKQIYYGTLNGTPEYGKVIITLADSTTIPIQLTDISAMVFLGKNFFKRLEGNVGAGFSFSKSSGVGQFNLSSMISYATKSFENQLQLSAIGSIDSSKYSRDNENGELYSSYNLNSTWSAVGLAGYQRNLELSIARRLQGTLGAGNKIILQKHLEVVAISGLAFSQEKSTEHTSSGLLFEIPLMLRLNFFQFRDPNMQINTTQTVYFSLSEKGRIRYSGGTDFSWELVKDFSFTINLYGNFDSKPPAGSNSKTDYGVVMGLMYKF